MGQQTLAPCPKKPNCVCSFENPKDKTHYIKPVQCTSSSLKKIQTHLESQSGYKLIKEEDNYLHFEFVSSFFKFIDDVEFLYTSSDQRLHFRSASRTGYSDLGANRKRIQTLLKELKIA